MKYIHKKNFILLLSIILPFSCNFSIDISAPCGIVLDAESGKILWSKKIHQTMHPASTTKILTAMLLIENSQQNEILTAPNDIHKVGEASIYMKPGEKISREDTLHAILLQSANDASHTAALHIAKTTDKYYNLANQRCKQIGCLNTNFINAHGLPHQKHLTTAYDLALIAREAIKNELFLSICNTKKYKMNRTTPGALQNITNHNTLLKINPLILGGKTGYTKAAGPCFVGWGKLNNNKIITVVLKSKNWKQDTTSLMQWGLNNHSWELLLEPNKELQKIPVTKSIKTKIAVGLNKPVYIAYNKNEKKPKITLEYIFQKQISGKITKGQQLGKLIVVESVGHQQEYPLFALESSKELQEVLVQKNNPTKGLAFISVLVGCCAFVMKKQKYEY